MRAKPSILSAAFCTSPRFTTSAIVAYGTCSPEHAVLYTGFPFFLACVTQARHDDGEAICNRIAARAAEKQSLSCSFDAQHSARHVPGEKSLSADAKRNPRHFSGRADARSLTASPQDDLDIKVLQQQNRMLTSRLKERLFREEELQKQLTECDNSRSRLQSTLSLVNRHWDQVKIGKRKKRHFLFHS